MPGRKRALRPIPCRRPDDATHTPSGTHAAASRATSRLRKYYGLSRRHNPASIARTFSRDRIDFLQEKPAAAHDRKGAAETDYDRLEVAELAKMLDDEVAAGRRHALIVAAGVFRSEAAVLLRHAHGTGCPILLEKGA